MNHGVKENETLPRLVHKDCPNKLFDVPFVGVLREQKLECSNLVGLECWIWGIVF